MVQLLITSVKEKGLFLTSLVSIEGFFSEHVGLLPRPLSLPKEAD